MIPAGIYFTGLRQGHCPHTTLQGVDRARVSLEEGNRSLPVPSDLHE